MGGSVRLSRETRSLSLLSRKQLYLNNHEYIIHDGIPLSTDFEERSSVEVSTYDFLEPLFCVECEAEEVQIAL